VIKKQTKKTASEPSDKFLPRVAMVLFGRPKTVLFIWLAILIFGTASYTTFLRREGFPTINIPIAVVTATYVGTDASGIDKEVAKPISEIAMKQDGVSTVQSQSNSNFASITVQYEESVNGEEATKKLEEAVKRSGQVPANVSLKYSVPYFGATGGSLEKIDAAVAFYQTPSSSDTKALVAKTDEAVKYLNQNKPSLVQEFFVQQPYDNAQDPATGQVQQIQRSFDQFGVREDGKTDFYNSVVIGVTAIDDVDVIKLDKQLEGVFAQLESQDSFKGYHAEISASFAPAIEDSISELQKVLLEGLLAVLIVGSIVIAVRASLITVISMITVIAATLGLLLVLGYTLNVITLFALILGLSLIVDDTIIMIEAIDAARRKTKSPREAVKQAVRKISRAMIAATSTAALSFLPLAFVSGVLGTFIRAIPITIISALAISLLVALVFIPLFAKYLLLGKKQMGDDGVKEVAASVEAKIAQALTWPMQWARNSMKRLWFVGMSAVLIGVLFIGAAGALFGQVTFNLFPPSKDTNAISVNMTMPVGTTIQQAQELAFKADTIVAKSLGGEFRVASYYGAASAQSANLYLIQIENQLPSNWLTSSRRKSAKSFQP
jgi:multidrug efflux pump subunit AcrB